MVVGPKKLLGIVLSELRAIVGQSFAGFPRAVERSHALVYDPTSRVDDSDIRPAIASATRR